MHTKQLQVGAKATWLYAPRSRRPGRCYRSTVRVLSVRKHTAWVETQRRDGVVKRRFVKLDRLLPGVRSWFDW